MPPLEKGGNFSIHIADQILSGLHFSAQTGKLQILSHMLTVCAGGIQKTWPGKRAYAYGLENPTVQSLGRQRI